MPEMGSSFAPNQYPVYLSAEQRDRLEELTRNGHASAKKIRHAQVLLLCDRRDERGRRTMREVADVLGMHVNTVARIRKRFVQEGEAPALNRKVRETPPRPPILDGRTEAQLIAICCSDPPTGRTRWTMQMLADEMIGRNIVTQVSAETVRRVLKKRTAAMAEKVLVHSRTRPGPLRGPNGRSSGRLRDRASNR